MFLDLPQWSCLKTIVGSLCSVDYECVRYRLLFWRSQELYFLVVVLVVVTCDMLLPLPGAQCVLSPQCPGRGRGAEAVLRVGVDDTETSVSF